MSKVLRRSPRIFFFFSLSVCFFPLRLSICKNIFYTYINVDNISVTFWETKNAFFWARFTLSQLWPSACNHRSADWWASSSSWHHHLLSFWLPLPPCELFLPEHLKTGQDNTSLPECEVTGNVNVPLRLVSTDLHTLLSFLLAFAADPVLLCSLGTPFLLRDQSRYNFDSYICREITLNKS